MSSHPKKQAISSTISLFEIQTRFGTDTRDLNPVHVARLAESMANVGLIEPIVVDNQNRLLAGGHRLKACQLLEPNQREIVLKELLESVTGTIEKIEKTEEIKSIVSRLPQKTKLNFEEIPVRVYDFDSEEEPFQALEIETSENTQRKDYTPREVRNLYNRLLGMGYEDLAGRPRKGQKPLKPALALLMGTSIRTVQRKLQEKKEIEPEEVLKRTSQKFERYLVKLEQILLEDGEELRPFLEENVDDTVLILKYLLKYFEEKDFDT